MDEQHRNLIKHREILFQAPHPEPNQAQAATLALSDAEGIHRLHPAAALNLQLSYDVRLITLQAIEEGLSEQGYHLDNSLLTKLKRAVYYYTEETQRANLGHHDKVHTHKVFVNQYHRTQHGCRDCRPQHWRKYL